MNDNRTIMDIIRSHQTRWPIPVVRIADDLGIAVYEVEGWPDNISGRIYRTDDRGGESGYAIDVNAHHSNTRRRFTIAHEIAHFVLHRDHIGDELFDDGLYRSGLPNSKETQANRLAADILMPRDLVSRAMSHGLRSPEELANAFDVSEVSMRIRLGYKV